MNIENYYQKHYPKGRPWGELSKEDRQAIRARRRASRWVKYKNTAVDLFEFAKLILMLRAGRK